MVLPTIDFLFEMLEEKIENFEMMDKCLCILMPDEKN